MKRRALLLASGAWMLAGAGASSAQPAKPPRRIVFVHAGNDAGTGPRFREFKAGLKALGYVEGRDVVIEALWGEGKPERLPALAAQAVARKPSVILTGGSAALAACQKATSTIPIVFATASLPVEQGFVSSLRRPGGNITGISLHLDLRLKLVEIAREALPKARRLTMLIHETDPMQRLFVEDFESTARRFDFEPTIVRVAGAQDFDRAFRDLAEREPDLLLVPSFVLFGSNLNALAERARKARLPLLSTESGMAEAGGLLTYGTTTEENYRRAAALVDKVLRGANPGDLPVELPERFLLVLNMKTAKLIGANVSQTTLLRADRVIEW